ncbi:fibrobacter succinogenes major paralogous domain-containing protein [uncultured Draconibacterium sp.]|uniref:fibrobacter succinogenes major paralogous domain-containing protein n=1 Tax=uncultured Draconibacterium sp. TaxID=1573823 RepID=UPI0032610513
MTDQDGNVYKTIQIGEQTWMAENLRVTTFRNGELIQMVDESEDWENLDTPAYCVPLDKNAYRDVYGLLYNKYVCSDDRLIAPEGWHIPNRDDWYELSNFLGSGSLAGRKMKEQGFSHWVDPEDINFLGGDNDSGFTALPAGYRVNSYYRFGRQATWFVDSTPLSDDHISVVSLYDHINDLNFHGYDGYVGFSIRCVKDE